MSTTPKIDPFRFLNAVAAGRVPDIAVSRLEAKARMRFTVAQALAQNRLAFHFQTVVYAANPTIPSFHEMVPCLRLPNGRMQDAERFLPEVADTEIGCAIDRLALCRALRLLAEAPTLRLALHVSLPAMSDQEWLGILGAAHRAGNDVCGRIVFQIHEETVTGNPALVGDFMAYVREMGPAFALDGFGAGATGFRHFRALRFDMVKIDAALVGDIHADRDSQLLVDCLQRIALHFDMFSVAKGVETEADAKWLCDAGIDCMQGSFYGRPSGRITSPSDRRDGRAAG